MGRLDTIRHNLWQTVVSLDQTIHCMGGLVASLLLLCIRDSTLPVVWADETLSSRCWRWYLYGVRRWPYRLIDILFWWDTEQRDGVVVRHCQLSWESECLRKQSPPELRCNSSDKKS